MAFFLLMYAWGVLSTQHYAVGKYDFLLHLYVTLFATLGTLGWFWVNKVSNISISVYGWLAFAVLLVVQPFLHSIHAYDYADGLLFPIAIMLIASLITLVAVNMPDDQQHVAIAWLSWGILLSGLVTVIIQFLQLTTSSLPIDFIMPLLEDKRLFGNIAQINQTGFILVLAIVSLSYLTYNNLQKFSHGVTATTTSYPLRLFILPTLTMLFLSIGLGFTASRAGLILVIVAILGTLLYSHQSKKQKICQVIGAFLVVAVSFQISHWLLSHSTSPNFSAVSRLAESNGLRKSLLIESWLAFTQYPLAGVGYGNFSLFGIQNLDSLPWLENANHAHNIIAQLMAEFGLLGLACFTILVWVMLRPVPKLIRRQMPAYQVYAYLLLITIVLYSLSEYPLWYARFVFLSAFLVGVIDKKIAVKKLDIRGFSLILLVIYLVALPYYIIQYYAYMEVQDKLTSELGYQEKIVLYNSLPKVYGYSKFQDRMLFDIMLTDGTMGDLKTALGQRVMAAYSYRPYIEKQATLLAYADQPKQASQLYHVLCKHEFTLTKDPSCPITLAMIEESKVPQATTQAQQTLIWANNTLSP